MENSFGVHQTTDIVIYIYIYIYIYKMFYYIKREIKGREMGMERGKEKPESKRKERGIHTRTDRQIDRDRSKKGSIQYERHCYAENAIC